MPEADHSHGKTKHGGHHLPQTYDFVPFGPASVSAPVIPSSINAQGDVVGFVLAPIIGTIPFVYMDGAFSLVFSATPNSRLFEINDKGDAVGTTTTIDKIGQTISHSGFLYEDGTISPITIPAATDLSAVDINNGGVSVGS